MMGEMLARFVVSLIALSMAAPVFAQSGDWPMWRHDAQLTGYQPTPGDMKRAPLIAAKYFVGASPGATSKGAGDDTLMCARGNLFAFDRDGRQRWSSGSPGYEIDRVQWVTDLDGDGTSEIVAVANHVGGTRLAYVILDSSSGKQRAAIDVLTGDYGWTGLCGSYIPGQKGQQIFIVTSCSNGESNPPTSLGEFALWSFDGQSAKRLWSHTPTEFKILYAAVMVGELVPGKWHGVINSWCHVWSIDLATGQVASHETWDTHSASPRQYGWNEIVDCNGDGALDYVNVSQTKHVDVLANDGTGKLKLAWSHGWMDVITTEKLSLRPMSDGIVDLDGDGTKEVVAALFDGLGDKRWHLYVWDGATGATKAEQLDLAPLASVPLWGEGKTRALLCARSSTVQFDPPEPLEAWVFRDGKLEKKWAAPAKTRLKSEPTTSDDRRAVSFNAMHTGRAVTQDADGDGRPEFLTTDLDGTSPRAWGVDANGGIVEVSLAPKAPEVSKPVPVPNLQGSTIPHLLAADVDGDRRNEILLYDNTTITVLKADGKDLRVARAIPSTEIPLVCDLLGDGKPALLTAGRMPITRDLYVQADDATGKQIWRYVFPDSAACGQYSDRPHYFAAGHFTGGKHFDVFTYSMKPQARSYVLNGRTGQPVYRQEEVAGIERHFQAMGGRSSAWDFDRDGADDILFLNPDYYCVADGRSGKLLVGPVQITSLAKFWAAYASPTVLSSDAKSTPLVYLGGAYSSRCAISIDGKQSLFTEFLPTERWPLLIGAQRFNEGLLPPSKVNAKWRVAHVEADGTLRLFEAESGKHLWTFPLNTAGSAIVTGDVDGDGEPELLLGGRDGVLYCIRDTGQEARVLWKILFEAPIASVLLADVDSDGKSEIIASVADGNIYVLDGPAVLHSSP